MTKGKYSSDKPIRSKVDDAFNHSQFAKKLASTIISKELGDGYVIGLYSEWGYGKTSTLNMIVEELAKDKSVVVVNFNPWLFTDQNTMIKGLFDTLADALDKKLTNSREKLGDILKKYSSALAPVPHAGVDVAGKTIGDLLSHATLDDLKKRAEAVIKKSKKRLIVVIDDVDRLDKDELFQLFKLIKIAVDFKNVVHLIAFDDKVVSDALGERYLSKNESGQSFLEKIIQIPLHLPLIEQSTLDAYVLQGIDDLLSCFKYEIDEDEVRRFREMFDTYISNMIRTPRMANRYLNALKFILPLMGKEINFVDLLVIESIRMLYPEEYKKLRLMKKAISGAGREEFIDEKQARKKLKQELETLLTKNNHKLLGLLRELFPSVDNAFNEYGHSYHDMKEQKKLKRVASPDYFDRYFTYGIPLGDVSDVAVMDVLGAKKSSDQVEAMNELLKTSKPGTLIKKLRNYENDVGDVDVLVQSLIQLGSEIDEPKVSGFIDTPLEEVSKMMLILISKKKKTAKVKLATKAINEINRIDLLVYFLRWVDIMSDQKKDDKIFEINEHEILKKVAAKRIKELARSDELFNSDNRYGHYLYHNWAEVNRNEVNAHLVNSIKNYSDVCSFLTRYASVWYGSGAPKRGDIGRDAYVFLSKVIDPEHLYKIIEKHDKKLTEQDSFPKYEDKTNTVGQENTKQFRDTVAKQFSYTHRHYEMPAEESSK